MTTWTQRLDASALRFSEQAFDIEPINLALESVEAAETALSPETLRVCGCPACAKALKAIEVSPYSPADSADGFDAPGFFEFASTTPDPRRSENTIPADDTTTASVAVGGSFSSTIDFNGDVDWIAVDLVAGETYDFTLNGVGGTPLSDPLLEIYNPSSVLVGVDDDGGIGFNSLANFTATITGTHYLAAQAYSSETGDYTIGAEVGTPHTLKETIDWGSDLGHTDILVRFAVANESFDGNQAEVSWTPIEQARALDALSRYSEVSGLTFTTTLSTVSADFILIKDTLDGVYGFFGPPGTGGGEGIGVFDYSAGSGWTAGGLARGGYAYLTLVHEFGHGLGLAHPHDSGGTSFTMREVVDSFDSYGAFDLNQMVFTVMSYNDGWPLGPMGSRTVGGPADWANYGWAGGLSALDIAVIQDKYGANMSFATGDDVYDVPGVNAPGTYYMAIWDAGGTDELRYSGGLDTVIDLRAATIEYEEGGLGFVSYAAGIYGGFTIANGVVIENASGGSGDDTLTGNDAANVLVGGAGADTLDGRSGADDLNGGDGGDTLIGGEGGDFLKGFAGGDTLVGGLGDDDLRGSSGQDTLTGDAGADVLNGGAQGDVIDGGGDADTIFGGAGPDVISGGGGDDVVNGGASTDTIDGQGGDDVLNGLTGSDTISGGAGADDISGATGNDVLNGNGGADDLNGGAGADTLNGGGDDDVLIGGQGADALNGGAGDDTLTGGSSADVLNGGAGVDSLNGGGGADTYVFTDIGDSGTGLGNRDQILQLSRAQGDVIDVSAIDADAIAGGDQAFVEVGAFTSTAGEMVISDLGGGIQLVQFDVDGDGAADMELEVDGPATLNAADFVL